MVILRTVVNLPGPLLTVLGSVLIPSPGWMPGMAELQGASPSDVAGLSTNKAGSEINNKRA